MARQKINKTNVARLLDKAKVAYELIPYEVDESDLSAVHVAAQLGEDVERVFKTIVLYGDKTGYFVCVVPGEHEIDLKKAARVSGNKKCELLPMKELLPTTGYIRGGCRFDCVVIVVSGCARIGCWLRIRTNSLFRLGHWIPSR